MTVQLNLPFETLAELVEQLPEHQQQDLLRRIQQRTQRGGEAREKMNRLRSAQAKAPDTPKVTGCPNAGSSGRREPS